MLKRRECVLGRKVVFLLKITNLAAMWTFRILLCLVVLHTVRSVTFYCKLPDLYKNHGCQCNVSTVSVRCQGGAGHFNDSAELLADLPHDVHSFTATGFHLNNVPQIGRCEPQMQLTTLDLSNNRITNMTYSSVRCLSKLKTLILSDNNWRLSTPNTIFGAALGKLRVLNLDRAFYNLINCSGEYVENCTDSMTKLIWYVNSISNLTALEELSLAGNSIWTIPSETQKELGYLTRLRHLNLSSNSLTFPRLNLPLTNRIEVLDISDNRIAYLKDDFLKDLEKLNNLKELFMGNNEFVCDCHIKSFLQWLQNTTLSPYVQHRDSLTCFEGQGKVEKGTMLTNVSISDLTCENYPFPSSTPVSLVVGILLGFAVVVVGVILFLNRSTIKGNCGTLCTDSDSSYLAVRT